MPDKQKETDRGLEDTDKLEKFKMDLRNDAQVINEQRDQANEDSRFINVPGGQWEGEFGIQFTNRAKLELDMISQYRNRYVGEVFENDIGVDFKPDDRATTDDDAELLNNSYRADYEEGNGQIAFNMAITEQADTGFGAYKLRTEFEDSSDENNEKQIIVWDEIVNPYNSVFVDASAKRPNKSDANWTTVLTEYTTTAYERLYPKASLSSAFTPVNREEFNYNTNSQAIIRVAERYERILKKEILFRYRDLASGKNVHFWEIQHKEIEDEIKSNPKLKKIGEREIIRPQILKSIFNGEEFFEEDVRIPGMWIPVITVYGYRSYSDGQERWYGLVRKFKDAQRMYNVLISQIMEYATSDKGGIPIFSKGQLDSPNGELVNQWQDPSKKAFVYVNDKVNKVTGEIISGPHNIAYTQGKPLDPNTSKLIDIIPNYINALTGAADVDTLNPDASGKAIQQVIKRMNMNTAPMMDNVIQAKKWEGTIYQSIKSEITNADDLIRTLAKDGTRSLRTVGETVFDEDNQQFEERNIFKDKKFKAYADVGPAFESQREESVENLKGFIELAKNIPGGEKYLDPAMEALIELTQGTGMESLKKMVRQSMLLKGIKEPENDEDEKFLAEAQAKAEQEAQQPSLEDSLAKQAESEAEERSSKVADNLASAEKKAAETEEILRGLPLTEAETASKIRKTESDINKQLFENVAGLPLN